VLTRLLGLLEHNLLGTDNVKTMLISMSLGGGDPS
jgi:hypothetical protein